MAAAPKSVPPRIRRFLVLHNGMRPREMADMNVNRFLIHLAVGSNVIAATQNQALPAVLFLTNTRWDGR
jgi:hypothetical protein